MTITIPPVEIEVCERTGDWWFDYQNGDRQMMPEFHAQIKGQPDIWACGRNVNEAIGNLVRCHEEKFTVFASDLGRLAR